jgi:hypothetical protein
MSEGAFHYVGIGEPLILTRRKQNGTCMDVKFDGSPRSTIATTSVDTFDGSSGGRQWFWMTVCMRLDPQPQPPVPFAFA